MYLLQADSSTAATNIEDGVQTEVNIDLRPISLSDIIKEI